MKPCDAMEVGKTARIETEKATRALWGASLDGCDLPQLVRALNEQLHDVPNQGDLLANLWRRAQEVGLEAAIAELRTRVPGKDWSKVMEIVQTASTRKET